MRRTGKEGLHSRIVRMDLKDLVSELAEKEAKQDAALIVGDDLSPHKLCDGRLIKSKPVFTCCGKYTRCNSNCTCKRKESADELCARLGFEEPSEEQKRQNLNNNLDYFFSQVR